MGQTRLGGALPNAPEEADERRQSQRITPLFRTGKLVCGAIETPCIVRDASASGVMIQMFGSPQEAGCQVLELSNGERFEVQLVWTESNCAGLQFHSPVELDRLLALSKGGFPKRQLRVRTGAKGRIFVGAEVYPADFENVSQQGAKISCSAHFAINQLLRIETGIVAPLYAKVRWRKRPDYGLVFERLLDFEELGTLAAVPPPAGDPEAEVLAA